MSVLTRRRWPNWGGVSLTDRTSVQIALSLLAGALLGVASLALGPERVLMGFAALLAMITFILHPELAVLALLCFVFGLIPARFNPYFRLAGRGVYVTDLIVLLMLAELGFRLIADQRFKHLPSPLNAPLLAFLGTIASGIAMAMLAHGISFSNTTYEARIMMYYVVGFGVMNLVRTRSQLTTLIIGIIVIGVVSAALAIVSVVSGPGLSTEIAASDAGVTRIFHPGTVAAFVTLMVAFASLAIVSAPRVRAVYAVICLITGLGVVLTLDRNMLISAAIALAVMLFLLRRAGWSKFGAGLTLAGAIVLPLLVLTWASGNEARVLQYFPAFYARLSSAFSGNILSRTETLAWRFREISYAQATLLANPVLGIGFEVAYRPIFYFGDKLQSYIHNAYLWLWMKMGILGLLAFAWLAYRSLVQGFRSWSGVKEEWMQAVALGFTLAFLAMLISNFVAPFFIQDWSAVIFAVILAANEVIFARQR